MNESIYMLVVLLGGFVLGIVFFGGLWFTVKKAVTSARPALWFLSSFFIRVSITLVGFYYLSQGAWKNFLISVLGFIIARTIIIYLTKDESRSLQLNK